MKLKVYKVRENAKLPERAYTTDAGMDLFYCPCEPDPIEFLPGDSVLLPTGLKMEVPENYMLQIMNKSGIATKQMASNELLSTCTPAVAASL